MEEIYYTVEKISQMLSIHPKTVQRYIREGKFRASKIGKSWRVSGHDLSRFTEENGNNFTEISESVTKQRIKISAVVDINVFNKNEANRIINSLTAAMNVKPPEYGTTSMHALFLEPDNTVRITLWGNIKFISAILNIIEVYTEQYDEVKE